MAMTITVAITVAEEQGYTAHEAAVLAAVQAHPSQGAAAVIPAAAPAAETKAARAPRTPKAAPAAASAASTTPAVLDTTLDEPSLAAEEAAAIVEPEEDLVGGAEEYTLEDAVTAATDLVAAGKSAQVKAALVAAGAKRVGELKGNAAGLATFMTKLAA